MGKRSSFARSPKDFYPTPPEAVKPLLPFLNKDLLYCEPCAGSADLINALPLCCVKAFDIEPRSGIVFEKDALTLTEKDVKGCSYIITNPPWSRDVLHPMIEHFRQLRPTWLLFDADWMHTRQAAPFLRQCTDIVSVGRVKWISGSKHTGKDNCAWYRFDTSEAQTRFWSR